MAQLTFAQVFGSSAQFTEEGYIVIDIGQFQNVADGGLIQDGLGINDISTITETNIDEHAVKLFYAFLLLIKQNQATAINDDASQTIFLSDGGKNFGTGTRDGQIRRVVSVNLFSNLNIGSLPDLDDV